MSGEQSDTQHHTSHLTKQGHPISLEVRPYEEVFAPPLRPCGDHQEHMSVLERIYTQALSGVVVSGFLSEEELEGATRQLNAPPSNAPWAWGEPNRGMKGGEIKTIGDAATPTFTSFTGPSAERYMESASQHAHVTRALFGELNIVSKLSEVFSELAGGVSATPPRFEVSPTSAEDHKEEQRWAPFNYRALPSGEQIYTHHDQHYRLPIYQHMPARWDRHTALSWFVTLQAPTSGGELVLYGLWGSDPNPPMLPSRFIDTEALETGYLKEVMSLKAGDLVIFDSGRHVHRVTPVEGEVSRLTLGGFMTLSEGRDALAFWA